MKEKRVFLIVLDSLGVGALPDADEYGDRGCNTLKSCAGTGRLDIPHLKEIGLANLEGTGYLGPVPAPKGGFARLKEVSRGKDTITGHWEIAGLITEQPFPQYPDGFPDEIIQIFEKLTGRQTLCNKPYSGTAVIKDWGQQHLETGGLIVYTSADSVFQIAAHEEIVPLEELYGHCRAARDILKGQHGVARVIARPFVGKYPNFKRTANRKDFSLPPHGQTMLDYMKMVGTEVIGVGKIGDIFANRSLTQSIKTKNNQQAMKVSSRLLKTSFTGLAFINLVDFDTLYGHRNNVNGYADCLSEFDRNLGLFINQMRQEDILIISADHGCDPLFKGTDHTREYAPMLIFGKPIKPNINLRTRDSFADIGQTILAYFDIANDLKGKSFLEKVLL